MKPADISSLRMLRRARDRIDRDYAEPIAISALACAAGYSREHCRFGPWSPRARSRPA